jgi:type II secretory pathway component GspD/PulD (secretin)
VNRSCRYCWTLVLLVSVIAITSATTHASPRKPMPTVTPQATVVSFSVIKAEDGVRILRRFYPRAHMFVDRNANAIIVSASPDDVAAIRQIASGIDTKSALTPVTQSITLHRIEADTMRARLQSLFTDAKIMTLGRHMLLISSTSAELQQMQTLISAVDVSPATPTPPPEPTPPDTEAVHLLQAPARTVARELANAIHGLRIGVAGQSIILAGSPELVTRAKDLITALDTPAAGQKYTAVYRIHTLDAQSLGDLIQRSFPNATVTVDEDINSISVLATPSEQQHIADAIARLDSQGASNTQAGAAASANTNGLDGPGSIQIYTMKAALPGASGAASTSATDLASLVLQSLQPQAPDLHINVSPNSSQMVLTGSAYSIKLAKELLSQLDIAQPLVVLDTEILEMDETTAKNLGIAVSSINGGPFSVGTIFSESSPPPDPVTGVQPPLKRLQPLYRTPISFGIAVNLAIQNGTARVLADPRITTLSGHMASIRAGDNISIPLTTGGGAGTIATTQIQTFQTGVTLDITPIVNADGLVTVTLHPVVNSLTGILNGVPQISTRDTQTIVALKQDETLVIGGLIQDNTERSESKLPILGDLPLLGPLFRNETLNGNRNELIISVTPHVLNPSGANVYPGPPLPNIPSAAPLPTLPPSTVLPTQAPTPVLTPPVANTPIPTATASPLPTPQPAGATPSQQAQLNTFTFGAPPASNIAGTADTPVIYYITLAPTLVRYGTPIQVSAITSTNVSQLALSYGGVSTTLSESGPGEWQGTFPFTLVGTPARAGPIMLVLTASKSDGSSVTRNIPVTVVSQSSVSTHEGRCQPLAVCRFQTADLTSLMQSQRASFLTSIFSPNGPRNLSRFLDAVRAPKNASDSNSSGYSAMPVTA